MRFARRHWGLPIVIVASACLALIIAGVLAVKLGPGLLAHSVNDPLVVVRRTAATVGVSRAGAFSPDGRILATGDERGVHSWDATTWRELGFLSTPAPVDALVFSPDSSQLAILSNGHINVLNMRNGQMSGQLPGHADAVAFSADSLSLEVFSQENSKTAVAAWELRQRPPQRNVLWSGKPLPRRVLAGRRENRHGQPERICQSTRSPGRARRWFRYPCLTMLPMRKSSWNSRRTARKSRWDRARMCGSSAMQLCLKMQPCRNVPSRPCLAGGEALAMAFSADGSRIALACDSATGRSTGTARVFELSSGKLLFDFEDDFSASKPVWIGFSPDGSRLATLDGQCLGHSARGRVGQHGDAPEPMTLDFSADSSKIFGARGTDRAVNG